VGGGGCGTCACRNLAAASLQKAQPLVLVFYASCRKCFDAEQAIFMMSEFYEIIYFYGKVALSSNY
jgi:hypothetical protein